MLYVVERELIVFFYVLVTTMHWNQLIIYRVRATTKTPTVIHAFRVYIYVCFYALGTTQIHAQTKLANKHASFRFTDIAKRI